MGLDSTAELTEGLFDTDDLALFDMGSAPAPTPAAHDPRIPTPAPDGPADPTPRPPDPDPRDPSPADPNPRIPDPPDPHVPNPEPDPRVSTSEATAPDVPTSGAQVDDLSDADGARPDRKKRKPRKRPSPPAPAETAAPEPVSAESTAADTKPGDVAATVSESVETGSTETVPANTATVGAALNDGVAPLAVSADLAPVDDPLNEFCADEITPKLTTDAVADEADECGLDDAAANNDLTADAVTDETASQAAIPSGADRVLAANDFEATTGEPLDAAATDNPLNEFSASKLASEPLADAITDDMDEVSVDAAALAAAASDESDSQATLLDGTGNGSATADVNRACLDGAAEPAAAYESDSQIAVLKDTDEPGAIEDSPEAVEATAEVPVDIAATDEPLNEFSTGRVAQELAADAFSANGDKVGLDDAALDELAATAAAYESDSQIAVLGDTDEPSAIERSPEDVEATAAEPVGIAATDEVLNEFSAGRVARELHADSISANVYEVGLDDAALDELAATAAAYESDSQAAVLGDAGDDTTTRAAEEGATATIDEPVGITAINEPLNVFSGGVDSEPPAEAHEHGSRAAVLGQANDGPVTAAEREEGLATIGAPVDIALTSYAPESRGVGEDSPETPSAAAITEAEAQLVRPEAGAELADTDTGADGDGDGKQTANAAAAESSSVTALRATPFLEAVGRADKGEDVGGVDADDGDASVALANPEVAVRETGSPMRASAEPPAQRGARWERRVHAEQTKALVGSSFSGDGLSAASGEEPRLESAALVESTVESVPPESAVAERHSPSITALPLPAHRDAWEQRVLDDQHLLDDIAFAVGGPFHLMYPQRIARNIQGFRDVFVDAGVDGAIYYGKKANKAGCVARACAENGTGIDVSSVGELAAALAQGVRGNELMVTGPAKSDDLLWLAVRHGALIALDALDELERLGRIASAAAPARVLLRVLPSGSTSRFGLSDKEISAAMSVIGAAGPVGLEPIQLEGFSFHLTGYDAVARAEQAEALIDHCLAARELGHPVSTISIGGGFGVDYVPEQAWTEFTEGVNRDWFHSGKSFESFYPYHFPAPGPAMLSAILEHGGLGERLRDNDIRLAIEPGRALLDGAGSTVFRVQGGKSRQADGQPYQLLTVDGTSLSLSEQWFDSEFLPDPVLWPHRPGEPAPAAVGAATCLESDMLSWRRIPLPRRAEVGDLLIYPNTAGYQMDSNESAFHDLPIPPKVVLHDAPGDRFRWTLDS
ncbi:hypothetical protein [Nocardia sp. XZ_19_385]|uniref:hypothetical protein n=1 Tax=Nocardia sp. XZ_19_385 TaxID=2769488 RepID=UPI00281677B5|nr:hypothetical protein [Nocardia sp. XZ_19_385]